MIRRVEEIRARQPTSARTREGAGQGAGQGRPGEELLDERDQGRHDAGHGGKPQRERQATPARQNDLFHLGSRANRSGISDHGNRPTMAATRAPTAAAATIQSRSEPRRSASPRGGVGGGAGGVEA